MYIAHATNPKTIPTCFSKYVHCTQENGAELKRDQQRQQGCITVHLEKTSFRSSEILKATHSGSISGHKFLKG